MPRDTDLIIDRVTRERPEVRVSQLQVRRPGADDDGLWFFRRHGAAGEVQLESSAGDCPFLVESNFDDTREQASAVDDANGKVLTLLDAGSAGRRTHP